MNPRLDSPVIFNCDVWPSAEEKRLRAKTGRSRGLAAEAERSHALQGNGQTAIGARYCVEQVAVDVDIVAVSVESPSETRRNAGIDNRNHTEAGHAQVSKSGDY